MEAKAERKPWLGSCAPRAESCGRFYSVHMAQADRQSPVPTDFPRPPLLAAIAGAQPKLPARVVDGAYVVGLTPEELRVRWELCQDLVDQLVPYCERKRTERPDWSQEQLLSKVATAVRGKGWDVSEPELQWVVGRVGAALAEERPG